MASVAPVLLTGAYLAAFSLVALDLRSPGDAMGAKVASPCARIANLALSPGSSLVLAEVSTARAGSRAVQLCRYAAGRPPAPLYHPLSSGDVDVSAGGRLLAYRDTQYRLHLVETAAGTDRVLGPGVEPRFSADGRYLAYITGDSLPLPKSPERLMVYALSTGASLRLGPFVLPRVGLGWDATSTLLAWSPRADALAWPELGTPKPSITVATFDGGSTFQLATVVPTKLAGEVTWADDGHGLLFWSGEEYGTAQGRPVGYLNLLRQEVPGRATRVLVAAVPTAWFEGLAPAPVPGPGDRVYASLLGEPPVNLNLLVLYVPGQHARGISLSGEPRLARFAPAGGQLLVIWTPPYGSRIFGSQASLIDVQTGHVRNLGPAVAAFWT